MDALIEIKQTGPGKDTPKMPSPNETASPDTDWKKQAVVLLEELEQVLEKQATDTSAVKAAEFLSMAKKELTDGEPDDADKMMKFGKKKDVMEAIMADPSQ